MKVPERVARIAACGFFFAASTEVLGFTRAGVRAGSTAASYQSFSARILGKQIAKNSFFARLQSLGATGAGTLSAARLAMFCGVDVQDLKNIWVKLEDVYKGSDVEKLYIQSGAKETVDNSVIFVNEKGDLIIEKLGNGAQKIGDGIAKLDLQGKAGLLKDGTVKVAGKIGHEFTEGKTAKFGQSLVDKATGFFGSSGSRFGGSSRYLQSGFGLFMILFFKF